MRAVVLAILCGLLTVIVYYNTKQLDPLINSFKRFLNSQKFSVRFLFARLGVVISLFWDNVFSRKYLQMASFHYSRLTIRKYFMES